MTIIDLTHPVADGDPGVEFETNRTIDGDGWNAKTLHLYSHSGTHMDAPFHFLEDGSTLESQPLEKSVGRCHKLDLSPAESKQIITPGDLEPLTSRIASGDRLVIQTGWSGRRDTPAFRDDLPRISPDAARWLVGHGIAFVGVEPPSVADVNNLSEVTEVHQILLSAGIVIAESLTNLHLLPADRPFTIVALPLKIQGGDGAPARIIALLD